ncbi:MAG: tetratricopeptide repeat protein [Acidimicrobiales bacterium]
MTDPTEPATGPVPDAVMAVTDATFEARVLGRSAQVPVVVDLWAPWCGPCLTLGPVLERVVAGTAGALELVKVDIDTNPQVAATFRVQSIPAVFAISARKVVSSFVGALPEPAVRDWVAGVVPVPSEVDELLARGDEESLRRAVDLEPANERAVVALAAHLVGQPGDRRRRPGAAAEVPALLARIPETAETRRIAARARVGEEAGLATSAGVQSLEVRIDGLLERVKVDTGARQELVDLLEVLGPDDPRTARYRRALTARLF